MKTLTGREFARLIEARGWSLLRVSGSHHIYGKTGEVARLLASASGCAFQAPYSPATGSHTLLSAPGWWSTVTVAAL